MYSVLRPRNYYDRSTDMTDLKADYSEGCTSQYNKNSSHR